jgi:hypothetical protein
MKTTRSLLGLALACGLFVCSAFAASDAPKSGKKDAGVLSKLTEKDAAWAAKARADYPLKVCVTSDEKLGSMGDNAEFIYRVAGQPDRLIVFCCGGCEDDFMKDPAKYLAKIDAAAKAKPAAKSS